MNASEVELEQYHELCAYTLTHGDAAFVHQYVVDAFAAQRANDSTKPITLTFALIGLYLHVERGQTGKQVQRVHTLLAKRRKDWPRLDRPAATGHLTVSDVMSAPPGPLRDEMIDKWCASVWQAYQGIRSRIVDLLQTELP